jgi:hypothetical protein
MATGRRIAAILATAAALTIAGAATAGALDVPTLTTPTLTTPTVTTPSLSTPTVSTPTVSTPTITTPVVTAPTVTVPKATTPQVTTPKVTVAPITTPKVTSPSPTKSVSTPQVTTPTLSSPGITVGGSSGGGSGGGGSGSGTPGGTGAYTTPSAGNGTLVPVLGGGPGGPSAGGGGGFNAFGLGGFRGGPGGGGGGNGPFALAVASLAGCFYALTPFEQQVLTARTGLDGRQPLSRNQLAAALGVSPAALGRTERTALGRLETAARTDGCMPVATISTAHALTAFVGGPFGPVGFVTPAIAPEGGTAPGAGGAGSPSQLVGSSSLGQRLASLEGGNGPESLWVVLLITLLLSAALAALARETRRSF